MKSQAPYTVEVDPSLAQQLADKGGALLVLDMPEGSYFGIDHMAFHCGPRFRGVKMLPPGPHFIAYSVPSLRAEAGGGMGPVTGFFIHVTAGAAGAAAPGSGEGCGSVVVRRYDAAQELLVELPEEEAERYALGVRRYDFDWGLAPYNLNAWAQWRALTSCLDRRVVDAVQPVGGNICTAMEAAAGSSGEEEEGPETEAEGRLRRQLQEGRAARAAAAASVVGAALPSNSTTGRPAGSAAGTAVMDVDSGPAPAGPAPAGAAPAASADSTAADAVAGADGGASSPRMEEPAALQGLTAPGAAGGEGAAARRAAEGRCFYSALSRLVKQAGLTPAQLTALNLDRTPQLAALVAERWGGDAAALVGEMQFAFIAFVFGQSLQGFRQWRALVTAFLSCEAGPLSPQLAPAFAAFTAALGAQLALALADCASETRAADPLGGGGGGGLVAQGSALVSEVLLGGGGRDCFLRHHLATFFEVLREAGPQRLDPRLQSEATELRALLSRVVGWQFDGLEVLGEDDDEDGPVVVELPPEQVAELQGLAV